MGVDLDPVGDLMDVTEAEPVLEDADRRLVVEQDPPQVEPCGPLGRCECPRRKCVAGVATALLLAGVPTGNERVSLGG